MWKIKTRITRNILRLNEKNSEWSILKSYYGCCFLFLVFFFSTPLTHSSVSCQSCFVWVFFLLLLCSLHFYQSPTVFIKTIFALLILSFSSSFFPFFFFLKTHRYASVKWFHDNVYILVSLSLENSFGEVKSLLFNSWKNHR